MAYFRPALFQDELEAGLEAGWDLAREKVPPAVYTAGQAREWSRGFDYARGCALQKDAILKGWTASVREERYRVNGPTKVRDYA